MSLSNLTTELLKALLLHLPAKDILLAQRVCKNIRNTIAGSKNLQTAIFKSPLAAKANEWPSLDLNPFIDNRLSYWHYINPKNPNIQCTRSPTV